MDHFFFFVMGIGFTLALTSLFIALSEDYYKWCRNRTQSVLPPCVEFQISKTTKRTAKKAVKKAPRKPIKRK